MNVLLQNIVKRFGKTIVVNGATLDIQDGEMFFLLGPSGCGKTTVLRMIAGFYQPDGGTIRFDDRVVNTDPPNKRNTGMVFQNYALWPHMSVAENVSYGLDVRDVSAAEKKKRVKDALEIVQMAQYAKRSPTQLSGGQQQRVALARALVINPGILLLDEPLSNLDAKLRLEMRDEIKRIHRETKLTTLYVTHDQSEALSLADRIAVMNDGRVVQIGTPRQVYRLPRSRFVANFIGEMNFLRGAVESTGEAQGDEGNTISYIITARTAIGSLTGRVAGKALVGDVVQCGFRPEAVRLQSPFGTPALPDANIVVATVLDTTYLGQEEQVRLKLSDDSVIKAQVSNPERTYREGEPLKLSIDPRDLIVFVE